MSSNARWVRVAAGSALMVLLAGSVGCGVSKTKYADLNKSYEEAMAKSTQLQASLETANKEKDALASEKATVESEKATLQGQVQQLEAKTQESEKAAAELKSTYESLIGNLKGELSSGKVEVQQARDGINVSLAQDILFRSGSAELDKAGREVLLKVADQLKSSDFQVQVIGHTDNQKIGASLAAKYPTNWELGGARAARIVRLFEEAGLAKERLASVSFADSRPREGNETAEGRQKNRRIEIRLRPTPPPQAAGGGE